MHAYTCTNTLTSVILASLVDGDLGLFRNHNLQNVKSMLLTCTRMRMHALSQSQPAKCKKHVT